MDFGSLEIVTAWRLTKMGVLCQAIVMDGPDGVRLVVIEDQQIVEWTRFSRIFELRQHVSAAFKARRQAGWVSRMREAEEGTVAVRRTGAHRRQRADVAPALLAIAEQDAPENVR